MKGVIVRWCIVLLLAACARDDRRFDTSGEACRADEECTCQVFTGAEFQNRASPSTCEDDGFCRQCLYM